MAAIFSIDPLHVYESIGSVESQCPLTRIDRIGSKKMVAGLIKQVVCLKMGHSDETISSWELEMTPDRNPRRWSMSPDGSFRPLLVKFRVDYIKIFFTDGSIKYFCPVREELFSQDNWTDLEQPDKMTMNEFSSLGERYYEEVTLLSGTIYLAAQGLAEHISVAFRVKKRETSKVVLPMMESFVSGYAVQGSVDASWDVDTIIERLAAAAEAYYARQTNAGYGILDNDEAHYSRKLHSDAFGSF